MIKNNVAVTKTIMTKASKHYPSVPTEYSAGIVNPGKPDATITIINNRRGMGRSFSVGDSAVYGSYNLVYTGEIVKITEKTITIRTGCQNRTKRLDLYAFAWRNYDYDEAETARRNHETMMYI